MHYSYLTNLIYNTENDSVRRKLVMKNLFDLKSSGNSMMCCMGMRCLHGSGGPPM